WQLNIKERKKKTAKETRQQPLKSDVHAFACSSDPRGVSRNSFVAALHRQRERERGGLARATFLVDDPIPWQMGCPPGRRLTGHAPTGSHPGTHPSGAPRRAKEG
ncbi:unnamed protein product, partial [Ixodes persulcatus]